jgi:hypothetical protein
VADVRVPRAGDPDATGAPTGRLRRGALGLVVAVVVAMPVVAGARAIADGWVPVGDVAVIGERAHSVVSADPPLVGMPTTLGSASENGAGSGAHHPGPLEFWALALPERAGGSAPWGLVVGTAAIGIASTVAVAVAARRAGGEAAMLGALALTAAVGWSLGRQVLVDPWNPHVAVLPLLAALVLAWAVVAGDAWALPALALATSWVAQAHVLFAPLAVAVFVAAAVVVVFGRDAPWELVTTAAVLVVAWALPVWEQLTNRPGNFVALWRAYRADDSVGVGASYAARSLVRAVGVPPLLARPAATIDVFGAPVAGWRTALATAVVLGLGVSLVQASRRRDRVVMAAAAVALGAVVVLAGTIAQVPEGFPDVAFYRMLPLWPVTAAVWGALALALARLVPWPRPARAAAPALVGAVALVAAPAVAWSDSARTDDPRVMEAVTAIARTAAPVTEPYGAVRVVVHGEAENLLRYGLVRDLRRRGVDARVDAGDPYLGDEPAPPGAATLWVTSARGVMPPAGTRLVTTWSAAADTEHAAYEATRVAVRARFGTLAAYTAAGRAALAAGRGDDGRALAALVRGDGDPTAVVVDGALLRGYARGWVRDDALDPELTDRLQDLRYTVEELTLRVYLVPPS